MFVYHQSHALRRGTASRRNLHCCKTPNVSRKVSEEVKGALRVVWHGPLGHPSYCREPIQLRARQHLDLGLINIKPSLTSHNYLRKRLTSPLRRHPRTIVILDINKHTLASQNHSRSRARAWQRRAACTVQTISERRLPLGTPADRLPLPPAKAKHTTFTHVKTVKAEGVDEKAPDVPYVPSPPELSPTSSSTCLNSSEPIKMLSSDPFVEDQARLAELAITKLERQSQRIIDHDPTVPIAKPNKTKVSRNTNKNPKTWLPLVYAESSDDNFSATNTSQKTSPLDAHAKVFLPRTRDSSLERTYEPIRKDSAYLSNDEGEFQLVTGKKMKPPSRPALGLNAHEVKTDDKPSSISAPFNKREINEVFGNDLPHLDFFQTTTGANGQVHFAMHPNGDVSAQQWSDKEFQWVNIGHFSNIRKRTEGFLASHRLKGETELHSLQQHTLAYFRAVAKQQEATVKGLPFGLNELQAAMPNVPVERSVYMAPSPSKPMPRAECPNKFPTGMIPKDTNIQSASLRGGRGEDQAWGQAYQQLSRGVNNMFSLSDAPSPTVNMSQRDFLSSMTENTPVPSSLYDSSPQSLTALNNLSFGTFPTGRERTSSDNDLRFPSLDVCAGANQTNHYPNAFTSSLRSNTSAAQSYNQPDLDYSGFLEKAQRRTDSPTQAAAMAQRDQMKASLNRLAETAAPRNASINAAARTVLHDPFQNQPIKTQSETPVRAVIPRQLEIAKPGSGWSESTISAKPGIRAPPGLSQDDPTNDLRISEPDFSCKKRPVEIVTIELPRMTDEQLALYSRPTPQNWNGPFFMGSSDKPSEANKMDRDEELRRWFHGSNTVQRQEEFFQRIKAAHKTHPGPIGPPSSTPSKSREFDGFNEVTTRLLIPVLENLSQYVQGPMEKRHGYFAPFRPPPEWCIDKGPNGNNSFFGEDWGQPPERIGRDSRYRPMPFDYGGSPGGMQSFNGRYRQNSSMKF